MFGGECYAKQIRVSDKIDILVMVDGEAPRAQKKVTGRPDKKNPLLAPA